MSDQTKKKKSFTFRVRWAILILIVLVILVQLALYMGSFHTPEGAINTAPADRYGLSAETELLDQREDGGHIVQLWRDAASGADASYAVFAWKKGWNGQYRSLYELLVPQGYEDHISFGFEDSFFWYSYRVTSDYRIAGANRTFEFGNLMPFWVGILAVCIGDMIFDVIVSKKEKDRDNTPPRNPF